MTSLTRLSLANRMIVGLATLAIIVFGVLATLNLKQELLPSIQVPTAIVTANYPGVSPQIVADEVSTPLERALSGVSGVTKVESTSTNGIATITVEWEYGLDPDTVVGDIRNAVDGIRPTLPEQVETEVITGRTDDIPVLLLAVASDAPLDEAGRQVENVAIPDLSGIEGVRSVTATGQETTQLLVTLRPGDLRKHDVTAQAVTQTVQGQATITPAGSSFDKNLELAVEVGTSTNTVKQFQALQVPTPDRPVALSAVADVKVDSIESTSIARADGRPALSLAVLKDTDADAVEISHSVRDRIPSLEQKLGNNTTITVIFDQAPLIEQSIEDLAVEGLLGLAFAVLVILGFLFSVRATLITAISIPLSLLIAMIALQLGEYSLNIFTLAALTVAVGRVVDDSIVVVENIKRRAAGHPTLTSRDILASVKEVAGAVTASTLTTVTVFAPVAIVSGVVGELFRPFAITIAVALGASLLVSMTIVPVLAYWFLREGRNQQAAAQTAGEGDGATAEAEIHTAEETKVTRLQRGYLPILGFGLRQPFITLGAALLVFVATLGSATFLKTDFLGSVTDQTTLAIQQKLPPGTRLSATSAAAEQVENILRADPQVKTYLTTIGGSLVPGAPRNTNTAEFTVLLVEGARADALRPQLQSQMAELGESAGEITVTMTNSEGTTNDLTVTVSSENTTDLQTGAKRIEQELETIPGLSDISSNLEEQRKVLRVSVDKKRAASLGFTQGEVGQAVSSALRGTRVGSVTLAGEQRDILVRGQAADEPSPSDIGNLELPVSQLQQQKAQDKAADALADKQQALADEQQRQAEQATADQKAELREQRATLESNRSGTVDELSRTRRQLSDSRRQLARLRANPPQPNPTAPPVPVTADTLAQLQWQEQVAQQTAAVAQTEQGIEQIQASIEQLDESITQINKQLDTVDEQASQAEEQRQKQQQLQDEQQALADVRAKPVKVKDVAKVQAVLAPTTVTQIEGTPSVTITATPEAADLGALTATIQGRLDAITDLPPGVTTTLGGAAENQQEAFTQLGLAMLVAIALVFMIMVGTFRSLVQPLILMVSIPFAATGAIAGLLITDTPLGVPAMVGLLMLIGIVVTNAIVLIDLINQYRRRGADLRSAIIDGARLRLRPIIMTACATIFALMPMALGLTGGGAFISGPLAIVVIGGLVSSTVLTLLLVPVLYSLVERRSERRRLRDSDTLAGAGAIP
ncbi:MAG TPA: efflux RND transporter permease subunit [Propionibacteriaceae bacterium]|nr:efflux RND transporter permease subunit [Propionibacteriaceae bacterium]